ncbi:MAG: hypothetical protein KDC46_04635 [Thermoleophilia bacterium]|nr:hypothetical protein [Thermoleophilia bacterium]
MSWLVKRRIGRALALAASAWVMCAVPASAGAASNIVTTFDATAPHAVAKGTAAYDITFAVTNFGPDAASGVRVMSYGLGGPIGDARCVSVTSSRCDIASIGSGETVPVVFRVPATGLDSFGTFDMYGYASKDRTSDDGPDARTSDQFELHVTDGTVEVPRVAFDEYPRSANRGDVVRYRGSIANLGSTPLASGSIGFRASTFQSSQAIRGMTISTGAPCGPKSNTSATWWLCPISGMAPGTKATVELVVVFSDPSQSVTSLTLQYMPTGNPYFDADAGAVDSTWVETRLNGGDAADLDVSVASPAAIKATRTGGLAVKVDNHGPSGSRAAQVVLKLRGSGGFVALPANCSGDADRVACAFGAIASGASASVVVPVYGTAVGSVDVDITTSASTFDPIDANDRIGAYVPITKAPPKPLRIKAPKASTMGAALAARRGVPLFLRCPRACTVRSVLQLSRRDANRLGIRARGKGPVTIGLITRKSGKGGRVTARITISRAARAKVARTHRQLVVTRLTTVTARDGAKRVFRQHVRLRPSRR